MACGAVLVGALLSQRFRCGCPCSRPSRHVENADGRFFAGVGVWAHVRIRGGRDARRASVRTVAEGMRSVVLHGSGGVPARVRGFSASSCEGFRDCGGVAGEVGPGLGMSCVGVWRSLMVFGVFAFRDRCWGGGPNARGVLGSDVLRRPSGSFPLGDDVFFSSDRQSACKARAEDRRRSSWRVQWGLGPGGMTRCASLAPRIAPRTRARADGHYANEGRHLVVGARECPRRVGRWMSRYSITVAPVWSQTITMFDPFLGQTRHRGGGRTL